MLSINISYLVIAIILYLGSQDQYGRIIFQETNEWALPLITNVTTLKVEDGTTKGLC